MSEPAEADSSELVSDWSDVTSFSDRVMGDLPVFEEGNTVDISQAPHLKALKSSELANEDGPALGAIE